MDYEYINACRIQSGLTNKAIAQSKNYSESTVCRFFRGEIKSPDTELSAAMCDAVGASVDRFCGIVKLIDEALTNPTPSIPAIVTDVVQTVSDIVDENKVADRVAEVIRDAPALDPKEIAREVVSAMPDHDCSSCRSAQLYEASIARLSKLASVLAGTIGVLIVFLMVLLICK